MDGSEEGVMVGGDQGMPVTFGVAAWKESKQVSLPPVPL